VEDHRAFRRTDQVRAGRIGAHRRRGNPPAAGKYQYWTNDAPARSLAEFVAGARETRGSWWPDWIGWIRERDGEEVAVKGARRPGKGKLKAIEDAPGSYVRQR
jgi:polyhydroxyalkanoate synthase